MVQRRIAPATNQVAFDPTVDTWQAVRERAQRTFFRALLEAAGGNKEIAWKRTGLSRSQSYEVFKQLESGELPDDPDKAT